MATALASGSAWNTAIAFRSEPLTRENGLFGDEEKRVIEPAITMARGWMVRRGALPADRLLHASHGRFDGVVAMYTIRD